MIGRFDGKERGRVAFDKLTTAWREQEVYPFLESIGAEQVENLFDADGRSYALQTTVGRLVLNIAGDTIFSRFDDEKAASARLYDVNPYSGKWNHHAFAKPWVHRLRVSEIKPRLDECLRHFQAQLRPLLMKEGA